MFLFFLFLSSPLLIIREGPHDSEGVSYITSGAKDTIAWCPASATPSHVSNLVSLAVVR